MDLKLTVIILLILFQFSGVFANQQVSEDCLAISLLFPRYGNVQDYVRVKETLPELTAATVCGWVDIDQNGRLPGHVLSYATSASAEDIALASDFFVFAGRAYDYVSIASYGRHHLCVGFEIVDSLYTKLQVHVDATKVIDTIYLSIWNGDERSKCEANGIVILGQDQDAPFGSIETNFQAHQSYQGTIGNFAIWDHIFASNEVDHAMSGSCISQSAIKLSLENVQIHGNAAVTKFIDSLES